MANRRIVEIEPNNLQGPYNQRGPSVVVEKDDDEPWFETVQNDIDRIRRDMEVMSIQDIEEEQGLLMQHRNRASEITAVVRDQLADANDQHVAGVRNAPGDWLRRARTAKRLAGQMVLQICTVQGELKKRVKAMRAAAEVVDPEEDTQVDIPKIRRLWVELGIALGELDSSDR